MLSYLIKGLSLGFYAGVLPGPTQAFILSKTIQNGWRRTLPLAMVPLVSDLPLAILFCLLVSTLPETLIYYIQVGGGGYLIYLGIQTCKTSQEPHGNRTEITLATSFWQTVGINLANPNVYVFWGTIGAPIVLLGWAERPISGLAFLIGMYSMLVVSVAITIMMFGLTGKLPGKYQGWLLKVLAIAVIGFGVYQSTMGVINII